MIISFRLLLTTLIYSSLLLPCQGQICDSIRVPYLNEYLTSDILLNGELYKYDLEKARQLVDNPELSYEPSFITVLVMFNVHLILEYGLLDVENEKLIELYLDFGYKLFDDPSLVSPENDLCERILRLIKYYRLIVENDDEFSKMIMTFDDGPYIGKLIERPITSPIDSIAIDDNSLLYLYSNQMGPVAVSFNQDGENKWTRSLVKTGFNDDIKKISLTNYPGVVENELRYQIYLNGDGELVTLFINKEFDFLMFFHSW